MHNSIIEIDSEQFIKNLHLIQNYINSNINNTNTNINIANAIQRVFLCLPVKANGYGHGLVGISKLAEPYVDYLAVACLDEGVTLRKAGINKPILVFGAFTEEQIPDLINNNLDVTLSSLYKARLIVDACNSLKQQCRIHIKIDTGMNRIGVRPESATQLIDYVVQQEWLDLVGIYSHLAASDEPDSAVTYSQIEQFKQVVSYVKTLKSDVICHLANSGGVCYYPESYFDMVRPGILSYGYAPQLNGLLPAKLAGVATCFSLKSKVVYFKVVEKGQGISYNHTYVTKSRTRIVTIPIGYGDGYRIMLSNVGDVIIRGKKYKIAGRVCMDMLMVDIGHDGEAYVDDEVVLIGRQRNEVITVEDVSKKCNTITYEILCGFNERIPRIYINK